MKYLEFDVNDMGIKRTKSDKTVLVSGAVNYFGIHFNFDEEFANIPGAKAVEFYKSRNKIRSDLVDNACAIPNELLTDRNSFEIRVVSGNAVGTQWTPVSIAESGVILPESPEEELPATTEYVKTYTGDEAVPLLKVTTNGLEYSQNGEDWQSGVSGVPEVNSSPKNAIWGRKWGDWVRVDKLIEEASEATNIDLSEYAKSADVAEKYATKDEVSSLQTLQGTADTISDIDYSVTDISDVISAYNMLLSALRTRGIIA